MPQFSRPEPGLDFDRYMRIALDRSSDRNTRVAAEAIASAILNGAAEVRTEAVEILIEEDELTAVEAVSRIIDGRDYNN